MFPSFEHAYLYSIPCCWAAVWPCSIMMDALALPRSLPAASPTATWPTPRGSQPPPSTLSPCPTSWTWVCSACPSPVTAAKPGDVLIASPRGCSLMTCVCSFTGWLYRCPYSGSPLHVVSDAARNGYDRLRSAGEDGSSLQAQTHHRRHQCLRPTHRLPPHEEGEQSELSLLSSTFYASLKCLLYSK